MENVKLSKSPINKSHFIKLLKFGEKIKRLLENNNIDSVLYGSLAYLVYTKEKIKVNDLDFLIKEKDFKKIIEILEKNKIKFIYYPKWHTMQITQEKLKIELDSTDFWQKGLSKKYNFLKINSFKSKIVTLYSLKKIYKKASEKSKDNPQENLKKYLALKDL